jgi:hypothetical protein
VLETFDRQGNSSWAGRDVLEAVGACEPGPVPVNAAGVRDKEFLARCDRVEAVCWLVARLADALDHAHRQGILHRDVKPSNILLNSNGRVMLMDFNLATDPRRNEGQRFGGTLSYMAPEHVDALNPAVLSPRESVDARSDIYSLGVVLFEMLTGQRPFAPAPETGSVGKVLMAVAAERRLGAPTPLRLRPDLPPVLDRVVRRCLDPDRRYQRASELTQVLDGCRQLQRWERDFPPPSRATRFAHAAPILAFVFLGIAPHVLGSLVNIAYNAFAIVRDLSTRQQETFQLVIMGYNVLAYPLCIWLFCRVMVPVTWTRKRLATGEVLDAEVVAAQRREALRGPQLIVALACLGWLPGGVVFPLAIHLLAGPVGAEVFLHFMVSFSISGLIATTYSYFGMQVFVLRILYPRLWVDPVGPQQQARRELGPIENRLRVFQFAAGLIPLSGAMLLMGVGHEHHTAPLFRALVVGLIGLGMAGFAAAMILSSRASRTVAVLLGGEAHG